MAETVPIRIGSLEARHAETVAELHRLALPKGVLSRLGSPFLVRLYDEIARAPRSGVWTALTADDECVGFISGTADVRTCYRHVMSSAALPLMILACPSLRHPSTLKRIIETLLYPLQGRIADRQELSSRWIAPPETRTDEIHAELLSLAVGSKARRQGIGYRLVSRLEKNLALWRVAPSYRVVTDAEDARSNRFYRSLGFDHVLDFEHHGHPMSRYHKPVCGAEWEARA